MKRSDLLDWIAGGKIDLVIGTHALIQEGVHFARLGVAVVDEQHRFGVHQRVDLKEKAGDVDPRRDKSHCSTISDKARTLGGAVIEAILSQLPKHLKVQ